MLWDCLLFVELAFYSWTLLVFVELVGHSYRVLAALVLRRPRVLDSGLKHFLGLLPSSDYSEINMA
jgi:hypothetical protein